MEGDDMTAASCDDETAGSVARLEACGTEVAPPNSSGVPAMGWASRRPRDLGARDARPHWRRPKRPPKEDRRLSERLVDLIAPYREDGLQRERYEALIAAAATAWNLSLLQEPERSAAMSDALRKIRGNSAALDLAELVVTLMRRKEHLFPDDDRTILDWEVSESQDQYHLQVLSAF